MLKSSLLIALLVVCQAVFAQDDALTIDRVVSSDITLAFDNKKNIQPKKSSFMVENYILMSNEAGNRWAVVTLKNQSTGKRIFQSNQLLALFANGDRKSPLSHSEASAAGETKSLTLNFSTSHFPVVEIYSYQ